MTAQEFEAIVGRPPEEHELDAVNCPLAGTDGPLSHVSCGVCEHNHPMFLWCQQCLANEARAADKGYGAWTDCGESADGKFRVWGEKSGFCYGTYDDIGSATEAGCTLHEDLLRAED